MTSRVSSGAKEQKGQVVFFHDARVAHLKASCRLDGHLAVSPIWSLRDKKITSPAVFDVHPAKLQNVPLQTMSKAYKLSQFAKIV